MGNYIIFRYLKRGAGKQEILQQMCRKFLSQTVFRTDISKNYRWLPLTQRDLPPPYLCGN